MSRYTQKGLVILSLLNRERALNNPAYVDLDITGRCNLQCPACPYHSQFLHKSSAGAVSSAAMDMEYGLVLRLFAEFAGLQIREVVILGSGEPLLHRRFLDILREGQARGLNLTVLTNGTLLDEKLARELVTIGFCRLKISLWATCAEDYEAIHGVSRDQFDRVLNGVRLVQDIKKRQQKTAPLVSLHFPVSDGGISHLKERVDLAIASRVNAVSFAPVFGGHQELQYLQLSENGASELIRALPIVQQQLESAKIGHNIRDLRIRLKYGRNPWLTMPCYVGLYHAKIKVDGSVHPCCRCNLAIGNVNETSFRGIWNSERYGAVRQELMIRQGGWESSLPEVCNCTYCPVVHHNYKIHRIDRFIEPLVRVVRRSQH